MKANKQKQTLSLLTYRIHPNSQSVLWNVDLYCIQSWVTKDNILMYNLG